MRVRAAPKVRAALTVCCRLRVGRQLQAALAVRGAQRD